MKTLSAALLAGLLLTGSVFGAPTPGIRPADLLATERFFAEQDLALLTAELGPERPRVIPAGALARAAEQEQAAADEAWLSQAASSDSSRER